MTAEARADPADIVGVLGGSADIAQPCAWRERAEHAEAELATQAAQRAQVRQRVRDGVAAGNFDLDVSNDLLAALGLPPLPRYWTVNVQIALTVTVAAADGNEAVDAVQDILDGALSESEIPDGYDVSKIGPPLAGCLADEPDTAGPPA